MLIGGENTMFFLMGQGYFCTKLQPALWITKKSYIYS